MPINKQRQTRLNCLLRLMRENRYPNHPILQAAMSLMDEAGAYAISQKSIQRDVAYLKKEYNAPIEYDAEQRGYYLSDPNWEWDEGPYADKIEMDAAILGAHLAETILPQSEITQDIRRSTDRLWNRNRGSSDEFMALNALVAQASRGNVRPDVFQTVFEAWRKQHCLDIDYHRLKDGTIQTLRIEPHVLTLYDNVWYLKARLLREGGLDKANPPFTVIALHRIRKIDYLPNRFKLDQKVIAEVNAGRLFSFPLLPTVKLKVSGFAIQYGREYLPVGTAEEQPDGSVILTLHDIQEYRLMNFILTSEGNAVIIAPEDLRQRAIEKAEGFLKAQKSTH